MKLVGRTVHGVLALWHAIAAAQNALEILVTIKAAPGLAPFASKNLPLVENVLRPLGLPQPTGRVLLAGASALEIVSALGFTRWTITISARSIVLSSR